MSNWKQELRFAILDNKESKFTSILNRPEVKAELPKVKQWDWKESPIHAAAFHGRYSMLRKLLENGADPNAYKIYDERNNILPIHSAVLEDQIDCVEILVLFGANEKLEGEFNGEF